MISRQLIQKQVYLALEEDLGFSDISAELIPEKEQVKASLIVRESAVLCGCSWFEESFNYFNSDISIKWFYSDGDLLSENTTVCEIEGPAREILSAERTAINFIQTLSATATITQDYLNLISNTGVRLVDTRKTIPGLRHAQKYAVRCGGAHNHRQGLYDGVLIKENHIIAAGSIAKAIRSARKNTAHGIKIEIEVETLDEVKTALDEKADILLLDNMSLEQIKESVQLKQQRHPGCLLEVSGGINRETIVRYAQTGIDVISVGALTKNIRSIDFSLRFENNDTL